MIEIGDGVYACSSCGAKVPIGESDELPWLTIATDGGKPAERVVTVGEREVHRCLYDGPLQHRGENARRNHPSHAGD
jgi:hypothetical protein